MSTETATSGSNPVLRAYDDFTDEHPLIAGYILIEGLLVLASFLVSFIAGSPTDGSMFLNEIAGLIMALAFIYGVIGLIAIGAIILVKRTAS